MTGREPMNPHQRQYALAGTLRGWAELTELSPKQERAVRLAYRGLTPWVFGRYGRRQWAAPTGWTRIVVKDPFAMLSIPTIARTTGAQVVLLYRHPAAALVSYRRMGWQPSVHEVQRVQEAHRRDHSGNGHGPGLSETGGRGQAETIAHFWSALYEIAMDHAAETDNLLVVSHEELSGGGDPAARQLFGRLGLRWSEQARAEMLRETRHVNGADGRASRALHDFNRAPSEVAGAWRGKLSLDELRVVEQVTRDVRVRLDAARFRLQP
jgi:hypothetical protein